MIFVTWLFFVLCCCGCSSAICHCFVFVGWSPFQHAHTSLVFAIRTFVVAVLSHWSLSLNFVDSSFWRRIFLWLLLSFDLSENFPLTLRCMYEHVETIVWLLYLHKTVSNKTSGTYKWLTRFFIIIMWLLLMFLTLAVPNRILLRELSLTYRSTPTIRWVDRDHPTTVDVTGTYRFGIRICQQHSVKTPSNPCHDRS